MDKITFPTIEKLYHYTSVAAACKILCSNSMRFGALKGMNDINEAYRYLHFLYPLEPDPSEAEREIAKYYQISFTVDKPKKRGYDISAMWGHYAERGNGVCLVFDKNELLTSLPTNIERRDIKYSYKCNNSIIIDDKNISRFFTKKKNRKELFFTKTKDWSYEQEFRLLTINSDEKPMYLPLHNSLIAIIMNFAEDVDYKNSVFGSENVKIIKKIAPEIPILEIGTIMNTINLRDEKGNKWDSYNL